MNPRPNPRPYPPRPLGPRLMPRPGRPRPPPPRRVLVPRAGTDRSSLLGPRVLPAFNVRDLVLPPCRPNLLLCSAIISRF